MAILDESLANLTGFRMYRVYDTQVRIFYLRLSSSTLIGLNLKEIIAPEFPLAVKVAVIQGLDIGFYQ